MEALWGDPGNLQESREGPIASGDGKKAEFAWDGYPERDPYRTSCSLPEGSGRFSVLKAMDSSGVRVLRVPDNAPGFGGDSLISAGERRNISAQEHR